MHPGDEAIPGDDRALEALLRDRKHGPPYPFELTPWDFARRWGDATVRDRVWPVVSRLLVDDDEMIRARAVELVQVWGEGAELTTPRLFEVAEQRLELFGSQVVDNISLRHEMAFALSKRARPNNGARVATVLREMAVHEPVGASVLGCYDPDFVIAQSSWIEEAARSLSQSRRDAILPFLQALRGLSEDTRIRVLAALERFIARDDEVAASHGRASNVPPPTQPAPSVDECKRAIGLST